MTIFGCLWCAPCCLAKSCKHQTTSFPGSTPVSIWRLREGLLYTAILKAEYTRSPGHQEVRWVDTINTTVAVSWSDRSLAFRVWVWQVSLPEIFLFCGRWKVVPCIFLSAMVDFRLNATCSLKSFYGSALIDCTVLQKVLIRFELFVVFVGVPTSYL